MKLYRYTLLNQDGTTKFLGISKKKDFKEFYKILNCSTIEHIPHCYYFEKLGHVEFWGDEEARFNSENHRNPHFKVLKDINGEEWDVVGNIIKEERVENKAN